MDSLPKNTPRRRTHYRGRPTRFSTRQLGVRNEIREMGLLMQIENLLEALMLADQANRRLVQRALAAEGRRFQLERLFRENVDDNGILPRSYDADNHD